MPRRESRRERTPRQPTAQRRGRGQHRDRNQRERVQLDVDVIVETALAIADREGTAAITMRAVAAELGVGVMSLYWHVPSKRHLEGLLISRLMDESAPPAESSGDWREDLASIAHHARRNFLQHPWLVDLFSSIDFVEETVLSHGFLRHIENTLRMIEPLPLAFETKMSIIGAIDDFTMGFTFGEVIEQRRLAHLGMTQEELHHALGPQLQELLAEGDYPNFTYFIQHDHELPDMDARFELALQVILDGIEVQIERATAEND